MNRGERGKRPLRGRGHLPQGELIALGSKGSSKSQDISELKPLPPLKPISGSTSKKTGSSLPDRKRDSPSPLQPLRLAKRSKTSSPLSSPSVSIDIESSLRASPSSPVPPITPIEVGADELEKKVLKAEDNNEQNKVDGYIMGALKILRSNRNKPDSGMYLSLFCLLKRRPHLFRSYRVVEFLTSLLKRDTSVNLKGVRPSPVIPIMACNILLSAFLDEQDWPESFIKVFVEDSLGDRSWIENDKCRIFVDNLLTAFSTKIPPRSTVPSGTEGIKLAGEHPTEGSISSPKPGKTDEEDLFLKEVECKESISPESEKISCRYESSSTCLNIHSYVVDLIKDQLTRRQLVDNTTRNLLRLMSSSCGLSEVRLLSSQRLEVWLQNPKLNRPAQELLMSLALNCNTHSMEDVEVISNIIKMRLKTKQLAAHYITCVRVLVEQHDDNLGTLIKHIIYNELSQTRNPNNMSLLSVLFQYDPEGAAKNLAHVFQDLLINREDYLRAVRALLREIVRALRHDLDFVALCRGLMRERKESLFQELESSIKERMFASVTDMITVTILLSVTPSVRDDLSAFKRGDQRELKALHEFQKNVAIIQQDAASWLHTVVPHMFPISSVNYQQSLSKVLFMEPPESYASKDAWPSESERSYLLSVISDVPVMDDTLTRVTVIGLSPELPVDAAKALKYVETLVQRAAAVKSGVPPIKVNRLRFIDAVLDLCVYHYPPNIQLPAGYNPPSLAIANLYWTGWIVIMVVAAFNPSNIGDVVWNTYPTIRCLMEMAMTNNFVYPPPTMVESAEHLEELQSLETQIAAAEKEDILLFETHLAAATSGKTITEDSSLLISQLISMVPDGPARKPPQYVIEQLKTLNTTIGIGKLFCRSRSPDFLLEIIQRQGASQSRPWLAELVLSSQESLDVLPVQCLCEFLLLQSPSELGEDEIDERSDKREETIKQVLSRLQVLLFGSKASAESTSEALECFMYRLHSRPTKERNAAERALSLIFSFNEQDEDTSSETYKWLLDSMPTLPYFDAVLSSLSHSLRKACAQELDFHRLQAYIIFLSKYSLDDFAEEVSVDLAHLLLERPAVFKNILSTDTKIANDTHVALLNVFSSVLTRALETNSANFSWDDHQDPIYIRWSKDTVHGGKAATLGVYIIHASMVLLTFGPSREDRSLFDLQLNSWCPEKGNVKMFLPNSGEEILLLPDWLRLKMICSNVPRLVDKAFTNIEPTQLVLFAQSFGIPVAGTSKILEHLDLAADDEPTLLNQIIIDKSYMLQLISVHRSRGAVGGQRFCELLNDGDVECYAKPFKEERVTPLRSSRHSAEPDEYMAVDGNSSEMIKDLVVKIFPFGSHRKTFSARDQTHYGFQLQKTISKEVSHLHKGVDISSTMTEQFIKIMIRFLESEDGSSFSKVFFNSPGFAHPYLRMLIARETILEKQGDNSLFPYLMDLLFQRKIANGPVSSLVTKYHGQPYSKHRKTCAEASLDKIREQVKHVQSGESLTNNEIKEIITGLKNPKNQNIKPTELMSVLSWLQSSRSPLLEEFLRSLISLLLTRTAQTPLAETNQFIQDMIGSLRARCDVRSRAANGAILDWLPVLDPDIANICPLKQRQLLFGSSDPVDGDRVGEGPTRIKEDLTGIREDRDVSQGLLLLVLLTHSGSWNKLQDSLDWLLSQDKDTTRVDPTAALRFVESCLSIPQLWQGRDTKSAKGIETSFNADTTEGKILNLSTDQLSCVVMYILMEAERLSRKTDLPSDSEVDNLLETRVSLLLRCSKGKEKNLCLVVERLENDSRWSKELRQRFLIQLYLYLPELLSWVKDPESLLSLNFTAKAKFGKFDGFFHRMISILSECQSGKVWEDRVTGVVLLCRKMASLHPAHILRNLPMISSLLRGRTHLTSKEFYNQNHFLFFTHILGLLDSLRPYIFDSSKFIQDGLLDALDSFLDLVQSHCIKQKERAGVVAKLVEFLQHFLTHNPTSALEYLQTKIDFLEDLLSEHSELSSLQSLLAVLSVPRTLGCDQSESKPHDQSASRPQDKVVPSSLLVMTPVTTPWTPAQIEPFLQRIGPNQPVAEVLHVLDDLDETSRRRIDILQFFLQDMARLTKDVNEACRAKAHSLLIRHLKQNPRDSRLIIDCYLECLSSTDPEVILSAAKVLPEIAILSAESADQLLEKAFTASTQKLGEVGTYITRTLQLFNME